MRKEKNNKRGRRKDIMMMTSMTKRGITGEMMQLEERGKRGGIGGIGES